MQRKPENEPKLAPIQGQPMFALLPSLEVLDDEARNDRDAAQFVGGPRLVLAQEAVKAKKASNPWESFALSKGAEMATFPTDQISDVMAYLGNPREAKVYDGKEFEERFKGRFDAFVDPVSGLITLIFRARVVPVEANPPTKEEIETFKMQYKARIESSWSGKGKIKPACVVKGRPVFDTKVVVHFVDANEHMPITLYGPAFKYDRVEGKGPGERQTHLSSESWKREKRESWVRGGKAPPMVSEQAGAEHEFGHAIGIDHVHCPGNSLKCYGMTPEEYGDIMGGGSKVQKVTVPGPDGKPVLHDDFEAFVKIGERYGKDIFPGALAGKCNKWESQA